MASSRDALTERVRPRMTLSNGSAASMTGPHPPILQDFDAAVRATKRFEVDGNAIITGGAGNLALEAVKGLLEHGLTGLALLDINPSQLQQAIEVLRTNFPCSKIITKAINVTNAADIDEAIIETATELGSVDILCYFAGVVGCTHVIDMTPGEWRRTLDVNTTGKFRCAQAAAKHVSPFTD